MVTATPHEVLADSFTAYWRQLSAYDDDLGIRGMLSTTSKIGDSRNCLAFNVPLRSTCCAEDGVATDLCRSVCYVWKMSEYKAVGPRAERNFIIAQRPDFFRLAAGAILASGVPNFKIHAAGDFFSPEYVKAWHTVVQFCGDVAFWAYTRAWRRDDLLPELRRLALLPNMQLWFSFDRQTGVPPGIEGVKTAWLADNDGEFPPIRADLAFRATRDCKSVPLRVLSGSTVCPHENGLPDMPSTCVACRICLP